MIEGQQDKPAIEFVDKPPLPRIWFINQSNNSLIQIQRDRFLYNWRKQGGEPYPRFDPVFSQFDNAFSGFAEFIREHNLGTIDPLQFEITYVNHFEKGSGWTSLADLSNILLVFAPKSMKLLDEPASLVWNTSYPLPNNTGRLYLDLQTATRRSDQATVLQFSLSARSTQNVALEKMRDWFEQAHSRLVLAFADVTNPIAQDKIWGKVK